MNLGQTVRGGPGIYVCAAGALDHLNELTKRFQKVHLITGKQSFAAFQQFWKHSLIWPIHRYDGTSSHEDMDRLQMEIGSADLIIGIGGGRVLDTAKGVSHRLHARLICVPTVLGTCAAATPLSIIYNTQGEHVGRDHFEETAYAALVDLQLLVHSPKPYFIAGIGDTLAKWYEARAIRRQPVQAADPFVTLGLSAALETKDLLRRYAIDAVSSLERGEVTPAFQIVADTIIGVSAMVGSCARDYGRASGAHAVHNAMSKIKETANYQHGIKVAYGLLVLLTAEGEDQEVRKLLSFYKRIGLPYSLGAFISGEQQAAQDILVKACVETEIGFRFVFDPLTDDLIRHAFNRLEDIVRETGEKVQDMGDED
ncbi:MAG: iron-containing alcohol dehydrogenase family protein [Sporolactobacillus sp.]